MLESESDAGVLHRAQSGRLSTIRRLDVSVPFLYRLHVFSFFFYNCT